MKNKDIKKREYKEKLEAIRKESKACVILTKRENTNCVLVEGSKDEIKQLIYNMLDSDRYFEAFISEILAERAIEAMKKKNEKLGEMLEEFKNKVLN